MLTGKDLGAHVTTRVTSERQALLQRLTASRALARAPRLRELLLDILTHAHSPELLTEHHIGTRVFGRSEDYNPADDNIVRAAARQLRVKLKEYFDGEGCAETVILEIPKGGYLPVFSTRPAPPAVTPPRRRLPWLWISLVAALLSVIAVLLIEQARLRALSDEPDTLFAAFLSQSTGPVRFVLTDSALGAMNILRGSPPTPEEYSTRAFFPDGQHLFSTKPDLLNVWKYLEDRQITSLADVGILTRLLQTHPAAARRIEIRHAKHMRTRDFKTGNFIVTGSHRANPWAALFDQSLNFAVDHLRIVNRQPRPGEFPEYRNQTPRRQWAIVALTRNVSGAGWVALAEGLDFEGTEGAGEFLLNPDAPRQVRQLLGISPSSQFPSFELLLETTAMEGTARSSKIVAWRRH